MIKRSKPLFEACCKILEKEVLANHDPQTFIPSIRELSEKYEGSKATWVRVVKAYHPYLKSLPGSHNGTWFSDKPRDGIYRPNWDTYKKRTNYTKGATKGIGATSNESKSTEGTTNAKVDIVVTPFDSIIPANELTNETALELMILLYSGANLPLAVVNKVLSKVGSFAPGLMIGLNVNDLAVKYKIEL